VIIDCHGHYTTAPAALETWRKRQIASLGNPAEAPSAASLRISDDELRESIERNQLHKMRERGSDLTIFSPRASFMAHHIGNFETSATWAPSATSCATAWRSCFPLTSRARPCCRSRRAWTRAAAFPSWSAA
jgi:4-oxalmesaconate hydratase